MAHWWLSKSIYSLVSVTNSQNHARLITKLLYLKSYLHNSRRGTLQTSKKSKTQSEESSNPVILIMLRAYIQKQTKYKDEKYIRV